MFLFSHHTYFVHLLYLEVNISKKLNITMKISQEGGILIKNLYQSGLVHEGC